MKIETGFINKLLILSEALRPGVRSKENRVAEITGEKPSAVRNWLFNQNIPPDKKKLRIADRLGVSKEFLFDNEKETVEAPIAVYDPSINAFLIPMVSESNLHLALENLQTPVDERLVLSVTKSIQDGISDIEKTYSVIVENISFPPFIVAGDTLIFNQTSLKKDGGFCLYINKPSMEIVTFNDNDDEESTIIDSIGNVRKINRDALLVPILLTISSWDKK
ncbi:hypothetical protein [Citrobacter koseri]|uniref:hypothetical protein n=1 Tax=Citrobacter koseri TaxID=545 RepID=UPI001F3C6264|nr:hypothetical protein [Citrobacter koseri]